MSVLDIKIAQHKSYMGHDGWGSAIDSPGTGWIASKSMALGESDNSFEMTQLHFAANALFNIATVHSVTLWLYLGFNSVFASDQNLHINVSNTDEVSTTISGTNFDNLPPGTGWKSIDITSEFAALTNQSADWYALISCDSDYDYNPYGAQLAGSDTDGYQAYIRVDFTAIPTACTAPTSVSVDNATPAPGASVGLSWSGAAAGNWNTIAGYDVYRANSSSGIYAYLKTVETTETYASTSVLAPAAPGDRYYYKIVTRGSEGPDHYSGLSAQYAEIVATTSNCVAPSVISFNTLVASAPPMMSWANAYGGLGNPITAYRIQYSESADGESWGAWTDFNTLYTTSTGGNALVPIAPTLGYARRYRIQTVGTLAGYDSDWSAASDSVRTSSSSSAGLQAPFLAVYEYPHLVASGGEPIEKGPYPIGIVGMYHTLTLQREYQGVGEFFVAVPFTQEANELLVCGNFDTVPHHLLGIPGRRELMILLEKVISRDSTGVEMITLRGKYMPAILAFRTVTASIQAQDGPVAQIKNLLRNQPIFLEHYDEGTGAWVDDINGDLGADSFGDRRFPDFHWREPTFTYTYDAQIIYQAEKLAGMLDSVIPLCKIEGCGLRVIADYADDTADTLTMWLELYMGIDRSTAQDDNPHVVFSDRLGNILTATYTHNIENKKTAGYATNGAIDTLSGTDLRLVDVTSENAYTAGDQAYINDGTPTASVNGGSGMNRSELGLTVSEIEEPTEGTDDEKIQSLYDSCRQIGRAEIVNSAAEHTLEIVINPAVGPQYRRDYDVGDIVTGIVARYGVSMHARIIKTSETYEPGKDAQIALTFGEAALTLLGRIKQIARRRG